MTRGYEGGDGTRRELRHICALPRVALECPPMVRALHTAVWGEQPLRERRRPMSASAPSRGEQWAYNGSMRGYAGAPCSIIALNMAVQPAEIDFVCGGTTGRRIRLAPDAKSSLSLLKA